MSAPTLTPTEFMLCLLDEEHPEYSTFAIKLSYRGGEKWAVLQSGDCLSIRGIWDHEPLPSSRTPEWIESHRFDFNQAVRRAIDAAPTVTVNGRTAAQILGLIEMPAKED